MERYRDPDAVSSWRCESRANRFPDDIVYSTNKAVLADDVGRRLENFFWRIWGNKRIRDRITGSQVAVLFSKISEGGFLRTTPTQSPRTSRSLGSDGMDRRLDNVTPSSSSHASVILARSQSLQGENQGEAAEDIDVSEDLVNPPPQSLPRAQVVSTDVKTRPSILKKPKNGSSSQAPSNDKGSSLSIKPTHLGFVDDVLDSASSSTISKGKGKSPSREEAFSGIENSTPTKRKSNRRAVTPVLPSETDTMVAGAVKLPDDDKQGSAKKRAVVHARAGASRRRPASVHRKSSQSSSSAASTIHPSLSRNPKTVPSSKPIATIHHTHSPTPPSIEKEDHTASDECLGEMPEDEANRIEDGLVDRDFRSKFASKRQSHVDPIASLPPIARKSTAAVATSAFHQASGTVGLGPSTTYSEKGKRSVGFADQMIPLKPPGASAPNEDDDVNPSHLPRTKSHLTLLLEKDKQKSDGEAAPRRPGERS